MRIDEFKIGQDVYLKGCKQRMKIVSIDEIVGKATCSWVDPNTPKIHENIFYLSELRKGRMNINFADVEQAFSK